MTKLKAPIESGSSNPSEIFLKDSHLTYRKKLEPEQVKVFSIKVNEEVSRDVEEPDFDAQSVVQMEVPPWAETYEFSVTNVEGEWLRFSVLPDALNRS